MGLGDDGGAGSFSAVYFAYSGADPQHRVPREIPVKSTGGVIAPLDKTVRAMIICLSITEQSAAAILHNCGSLHDFEFGKILDVNGSYNLVVFVYYE